MSVFRVSSVILMVGTSLLAIAALEFLPSNYPEFGRECTFVILMSWVFCNGVWLYQTYVRFRASDRKWLDSIACGLASLSLIRQRKAVVKLSLVFGERFGHPGLFYGSKLDLCCKLWRKWWDENHDELLWCSELGVYIEKKLLPKDEELVSTYEKTK